VEDDMSETFKDIFCTHAGRTNQAPWLIDKWYCDAEGRRWTSLALQTMGDADELHRTRLVYAAEIGYNVDAHLDRNGKTRHIGGVHRTKRGWTFTCGACGLAPRVRHHRMVQLMQDLRSRGEAGIELADLDTPSHVHHQPSPVC